MHPSPRFHAYRLWLGGCSSANSRHRGVTVRFCVEFGPRSPPRDYAMFHDHVPSAAGRPRLGQDDVIVEPCMMHNIRNKDVAQALKHKCSS